MDRTPPPTSLAAALALPRTPGRSSEVFVDGDLEVRFAARPTNGPQVPHLRDELYFVAAGTGRYRVEDSVIAVGPGDRAVLRRAYGARLRGYLGGFFRLGAVLRPGQATSLSPKHPAVGLPDGNIPLIWGQRCLPPDHGGTGQRRGGRLSPPNAADTRRTDRPPFRRPEVRDSRRRFRPHGPRLRPRSTQTQPAPSMRPETPPPAQLGHRRASPTVRRCRASVRTCECSITSARNSTGAAAS